MDQRDGGVLLCDLLLLLAAGELHDGDRRAIHTSIHSRCIKQPSGKVKKHGLLAPMLSVHDGEEDDEDGGRERRDVVQHKERKRCLVLSASRHSYKYRRQEEGFASSSSFFSSLLSSSRPSFLVPVPHHVPKFKQETESEGKAKRRAETRKSDGGCILEKKKKNLVRRRGKQMQRERARAGQGAEKDIWFPYEQSLHQQTSAKTRLDCV